MVNLSIWRPKCPQPTQEALTISREEKAYNDFLQRIALIPELVEKINNSTGDATQMGFNIKMIGLANLDDATLLRMFELKQKLLYSLDEKTCATWSRGGAVGSSQDATLKVLTDSELNAYYDILYDATLIGSKTNIKPKLDDELIKSEQKKVYDKLGAEQAKRLTSASANPQLTSDEDACNALKTLYSTIQILDDSDKKIWARMLAPSY